MTPELSLSTEHLLMFSSTIDLTERKCFIYFYLVRDTRAYFCWWIDCGVDELCLIEGKLTIFKSLNVLEMISNTYFWTLLYLHDWLFISSLRDWISIMHWLLHSLVIAICSSWVVEGKEAWLWINFWPLLFVIQSRKKSTSFCTSLYRVYSKTYKSRCSNIL